jgi:hypothetical protein
VVAGYKWFVSCADCWAHGPLLDTKDAAVAEWNGGELRAQLAAVPFDSLKRIVDAVLLGATPLQFDLDAGAAWIKRDPYKHPSFDELKERFGHYFDAIEDVDEWVRQQRRGE